MTDIREELAAALEASSKAINDMLVSEQNPGDERKSKKAGDAIWHARSLTKAALSRHRAAKEAEGDLVAALGRIRDMSGDQPMASSMDEADWFRDRFDTARRIAYAALTKARPHD